MESEVGVCETPLVEHIFPKSHPGTLVKNQLTQNWDYTNKPSRFISVISVSLLPVSHHLVVLIFVVSFEMEKSSNFAVASEDYLTLGMP